MPSPFLLRRSQTLGGAAGLSQTGFPISSQHQQHRVHHGKMTLLLKLLSTVPVITGLCRSSVSFLHLRNIQSCHFHNDTSAEGAAADLLSQIKNKALIEHD